MKLRLKLQSCLNCGSVFMTYSLFCKPCSSLLLDSFRATSIKESHGLQFRPLFVWPPGKSDSLSRLILEMKEGSSRSWDFYAETFFAQYADQIDHRNLVFVSHKSTSGNPHAYNWAESLRRVFGGVHLEALELDRPQGAQKTMSVSQRGSRKMRSLVEISAVTDQNLVFVDDVVTTGSTALAGYKALGQPKNYQVWCLAWRPASAIATR